MFLGSTLDDSIGRKGVAASLADAHEGISEIRVSWPYLAGRCEIGVDGKGEEAEGESDHE